MRVRSGVAIGVMLLMVTASACGGTSVPSDHTVVSPTSLSSANATPTSAAPSQSPPVQVDIPVPSPSGVVVAFGNVWVQSADELWKVASDGRVIDRFTGVSASPKLAYMGFGGAGYQTLAAGFGSLWTLVDGDVLRVDPANGHVIARIGARRGRGSIAVGEGAVWVACCTVGMAVGVIKIDPATNKVSGHRRLGQSIASLSVGGGFVWVLGIGEVPFLEKIDPSTLKIVNEVATDARGVIAAGSDSVWVMDHGSRLDRVDISTCKIEHRFDLSGRTMMAVAPFGDGALVNAGNLIQVSGSSNKVETIARLAERVVATAGIAVDGGGDHPLVWLTEPSDETLVAVQL